MKVYPCATAEFVRLRMAIREAASLAFVRVAWGVQRIPPYPLLFAKVVYLVILILFI